MDGEILFKKCIFLTLERRCSAARGVDELTSRHRKKPPHAPPHVTVRKFEKHQFSGSKRGSSFDSK